MLARKVTPEMVKEWKETAATFRPRLRPGRKTGAEIVAYLAGKYPVREIPAESIAEVIGDNVLLNECNAMKLPAGKMPDAVGFIIENAGAGEQIYETQDEIFRGMPVIVGVDLTTGYFIVEGSSLLWDDLFAFRGLDAEDLENYYLVAEYVACLRRFGLLDDIISRTDA
ncbi:MAG: hypothetical protein CVV32_09815 [Methanomicrobiales archaeon HGW-Methanomicrobiales-3]|jgi:hypothetical protein|nr:MAG: hypothetical protein CVV32_09815 [Methanomicrobiales archaeon HGW-Methanomicrobiales-3]